MFNNNYERIGFEFSKKKKNGCEFRYGGWVYHVRHDYPPKIWYNYYYLLVNVSKDPPKIFKVIPLLSF